MTDKTSSKMRTGYAIANGLFTEEPSLSGSHCDNCGEMYFPVRSACSKCSSRDLKVTDLGDRGVLWSWTIQHFMPKPPYNSGETNENFTPYGIGLIEMPSGVKVKARLNANEAVDLKIGDPYVLKLEPFRTHEDGEPVLTFVFEREKRS